MTGPLKKPVVTLSVWNFCQNSCSYCASKSNLPEWKYSPNKPIEKKWITDIEASVSWIEKYRPDAAIHLSGGEPLLRPDIVEIVDSLLSKNFDVSIFSNGQNLPFRKELVSRNVKWCLTYHRSSGWGLEYWVRTVAPLRDCRHLVTSIETFDTVRSAPSKFLDGWNYLPRFRDYPIRTAGDESDGDNCDTGDAIASRMLTLIVDQGFVYPCNTIRRGVIGNVHHQTYYHERARLIDAHAATCIRRNICGAYRSAVAMERL